MILKNLLGISLDAIQPDAAAIGKLMAGAKRLWVRTKNGHYFPNPEMRLRAAPTAEEGWQPVCERLALDWIDRGCGREIDHRPRPSESIQWVREALSRAAEPEPPAAEPDGLRRLF